jgi:hypothetical protein
MLGGVSYVFAITPGRLSGSKCIDALTRSSEILFLNR